MRFSSLYKFTPHYDKIQLFKFLIANHFSDFDHARIIELMEIYIVTGPPYSGKGTHCKRLEETLRLKHVSTGEQCRKEKQHQTNIGKLIADYTEKGDLVPDAVMKTVIDNTLNEYKDSAGIILDGYPRTVDQVNTLWELVQVKGLSIKKVISIEVPTEELLRRAKERAETSDREDDKNPDTHMKRITLFESTTKPAIIRMKELMPVTSVEAMGSIEENAKKVKAAALS